MLDVKAEKLLSWAEEHRNAMRRKQDLAGNLARISLTGAFVSSVENIVFFLRYDAERKAEGSFGRMEVGKRKAERKENGERRMARGQGGYPAFWFCSLAPFLVFYKNRPYLQIP